MLLNYQNKATENEILNISNLNLGNKLNINSDYINLLIQSDNIEALKLLLYDYNLKNKIDLIYIDPPFSTNITFKMNEGRANTISSSNNGTIAYKDNLQGADFIEFLRRRLILLRELMSEKASIYLHIDYKIGHYVKVMMDEVFGINNFRNDITRIKCNPKNFSRKAFGNIKDLILFYTKTDNFTWNDVFLPYTKDDIEKLFKKTDEKGRKYTTIPLHAPGETKNGSTNGTWKGVAPPEGRHWRCNPIELDELENKKLIEWSSNGVPRKIIYADEEVNKGKKMQDIWEFKDPQYPVYPTEKNLELLKLIIKTSSNEGDIVLDSFCGSGTTLYAANQLNRKWIGIDESESAINVTKRKLSKFDNSLFTQNSNYKFFSI